MSEQANPDSIEHSASGEWQKLPQGATSQYIEGLLANHADTITPGVVMDRLVGSIFRAEGVQRAGQDVAHLQEVIKGTEGQKIPAMFLSAFTRTEGVRRALAAVGANSLVGGQSALDSFQPPIADPASGELLLGSLDQVAGYVETAAPAEAGLGMEGATPWKQTLLQEITDYVNHPSTDVQGAWKTRDHVGSSAASVKARQQAWDRAEVTARQAGLDMDFLTRSADMLRDKHLSGARMANLPVGSPELVQQPFQTEPVTDYGHLLEP